MADAFPTTLLAVLTENGLTQADVWRDCRDRGEPVSRSAISQWCTIGGTRPSVSRFPGVLAFVCRTAEQRDRLMAAFFGEA